MSQWAIRNSWRVQDPASGAQEPSLTAQETSSMIDFLRIRCWETTVFPSSPSEEGTTEKNGVKKGQRRRQAEGCSEGRQEGTKKEEGTPQRPIFHQKHLFSRLGYTFNCPPSSVGRAALNVSFVGCGCLLWCDSRIWRGCGFCCLYVSILLLPCMCPYC